MRPSGSKCFRISEEPSGVFLRNIFEGIEQLVRHDKLVHDNNLTFAVNVIRHRLHDLNPGHRRRETADLDVESLEEPVIIGLDFIAGCDNCVTLSFLAGVVERCFCGDVLGVRNPGNEKRKR